jgi:autotransporter-associated beta strand protein/T5SS/PEP-CTERM-associated repeat protein
MKRELKYIDAAKFYSLQFRLAKILFVYCILNFVMLNRLPGAGIIWNGSTSTDFEVGTNWDGGVVPTNDVTTDSMVVSSVPGNMPTFTVNRSLLNVNLNVGGLTLGGTGIDVTLGSGGIDSVGAGTNYIDFNPIVDSSSNQTWIVESGNTLHVQGQLKGPSSTVILDHDTGGNIIFSANNTFAGDLYLNGNAGQTGITTVTGQMDSLRNLRVSSSASNEASLILTGSSASISTTFSITVANSGEGTFTIQSGADVSAGNSSSIGSSAGTTGTMNITGSGSSFTLTGGSMRIGDSGTGTMTISNGAAYTSNSVSRTYIGRSGSSDGTLTVQSGSTFSGGGGITVGEKTGSTGSVALTGSGTNMTVSNNSRVGESGTGTMTVSDGATFSGTGNIFSVGVNAGSNGTLTVQTGATFNSDRLLIANGASASGTATITGSGTTMNLASGTTGIQLGVSGGGATVSELHIDDSAVVNVTGNVGLNNGSVLDFNNGTLNVTGTFSNEVNSTLQGHGTFTKDFALGGVVFDGSAGQTLEINGVLSSTGALTKNGAGILKLSGSSANTFSGATTINAGTLELAKSASTNAIASNIDVTSSATLKLGASNQIADSVDITLSGGTIDINVYQEGSAGAAGIDNLIVSSASTIDFTGIGGIFRFTDDTGSTSSANILTIDNWGGISNGTHNTDLSINTTGDRLLIGASDFAVLSRATDIVFTGWSTGAKFLETSLGSGIYEVLPDVEGQIWDGSTSGAWETTTNWVGNTEPDGVNQVAIFNSTGFASNGTVTLGAGKTVGQIVIDSNDYTIQSNTITMDGASGAGITIIGSSVNATISSNLALNDNLSVNVSNNSNLTLSGGISGGNALTKLGQGTLVLSGTNTYTGNTTVSLGTLNLTGSVDGGIVLNGGTLIGGSDANALAAVLTMSSGTLSSNTIGTTGQFNVKGSGTSSWTGGLMSGM